MCDNCMQLTLWLKLVWEKVQTYIGSGVHFTVVIVHNISFFVESVLS